MIKNMYKRIFDTLSKLFKKNKEKERENNLNYNYDPSDFDEFMYSGTDYLNCQKIPHRKTKNMKKYKITIQRHIQDTGYVNVKYNETGRSICDIILSGDSSSYLKLRALPLEELLEALKDNLESKINIVMQMYEPKMYFNDSCGRLELLSDLTYCTKEDLYEKVS